MHGIWKHLQGGLFVAVLVAVVATTGWAAADAPDTIQLDTLAQFYSAVDFDHSMHTSLAEDCATCHHHTTGSAPLKQECTTCHAEGQTASAVACNECHARASFSASYLREKDSDVNRYHTDKLGLKGAYHQSCMGCHQDMGGPTGCQDCHVLNETGEAFYHTGSFAPKPGIAAHSEH